MFNNLKKTVLGCVMTLCLGASALAVELTHWPEEAAEQLNQLIKTHAHKGEFAVFDMDNTTYRNDLEESLIPFLENKGVLTRENLDPSLKLIPFKDDIGQPETLYSYYQRLCELDDLICYPWAAQVFAGFSLKTLKGYVDEMIMSGKPVPVRSIKNGEWVRGAVHPPKMMAGMQELFAKLQENGIAVYIMSAASEELVRMVASDPAYGYNVPPENVLGVTLLLKNPKTGRLTTSRNQIKAGKYNPKGNLDLELTPYLVNPMTWFEGKAGSMIHWIDQWRKPILAGGDTLYSDTYMLFNSVDVDRGGMRLWITRSPETLKKLNRLAEQEAKKQRALGQTPTANKNWVFATQDELQ